MVRDELMTLMSLARSTNAGGINWPGDLGDKKGLALDRAGSFLTRIANFIPLDKFVVELPSEFARNVASPVNVHQFEFDEKKRTVPVGKAGKPCQIVQVMCGV